MVFIITLEGRPRLYLPGLPSFDTYPQALEAARLLYASVGIPIAVLTGPPLLARHPLLRVSYDYTPVDGFNPRSWDAGGTAAHLSVKEWAARLITAKQGPELVGGEFPQDGAYRIYIRSGPATATALLLSKSHEDTPDSPLDTPAAPSLQDLAPGKDGGPPLSVGVWQWRVLRFDRGADGHSFPHLETPDATPWTAPGASELTFDSTIPGEPFLVQCQDLGDEVTTAVWHGPLLLPAPSVLARWQRTPIGPRLYVEATMPDGAEWYQNGGRLLGIVLSMRHTSTHVVQTANGPVNYNQADAPTPGRWAGPGAFQNDGRLWNDTVFNHPTDRQAGALVTQEGDTLGEAGQPQEQHFCGMAWAEYGVGEPSYTDLGRPARHTENIYRLDWSGGIHLSAFAFDCSPGPPPDDNPPPVIPAPVPRLLNPDGCSGARNAMGYDAQNNELYVSGDNTRVRLRFDSPSVNILRGTGGVDVDAGAVIDTSPSVGPILDYLVGSPCVTLGISLGASFNLFGGAGKRANIAGVSPYLELGTGGSNPQRIPLFGVKD